jgi:uncharacterized membrane protein
MGKFFFWMVDPPDPQILVESWTNFLDLVAAVSIILIVVTVILTAWLYSVSANRRKIHVPNDLFAPYTPMRWLLLALVPLIITGGVAAWKYQDMLSSGVGEASTAVQVALWSGLLTFLLAYTAMLLPHITPAKFRYRPLWLFYKNKGSKA